MTCESECLVNILDLMSLLKDSRCLLVFIIMFIAMSKRLTNAGVINSIRCVSVLLLR